MEYKAIIKKIARKQRKKGINNDWDKWKTNSMTDLTTSIIILSGSGIKIPIKKQRLSIWTKSRLNNMM